MLRPGWNVIPSAARYLVTSALLATPLAAQSLPAPTVLDNFDGAPTWTAHPSDGVALKIGSGPGVHGRAMRLDFDFQGRAGYAIARKTIALDLPENYQFSFWIKGSARPNTLEFKVIDPSGDNVWWTTRPSYEFPKAWQQITVRQRHLKFAWGPMGGGVLRKTGTIELVITAAQGGAGTVWVDDFTFEPRDPERPYDKTPRLAASASAGGHRPSAALDGDSLSSWQTPEGDSTAWLELDFLALREFGGLRVDWEPGRQATEYAVETSADGKEWRAAHAVRRGNGGRDYISLPESETRWLRLRLARGVPGKGYGVREIAVEPVEWSASPIAFLRAVAREAPRGSYPRYVWDEQSFWTIVGASGDGRRGLLNEDGALETIAGGFSIEPFLWCGGRLVTWNDAERAQELARGDLPIPTVTWKAGDLELSVTAFAAGTRGTSSILARYRVVNRGATRKAVTLFLAVRPFQVNPPWQFLNAPGGFGPVRRIAATGRTVAVNGERIVSLTPLSGFGAASFDEGEIVEHLRAGQLPPRTSATDTSGRASGALEYRLDLAPGGESDVSIEAPLYGGVSVAPTPSARAAREYVEHRLAETTTRWTALLDRVGLELPPSAAGIVKTIKSTLAFILINRDSVIIEPGARSYRRAWIRDGALISTALLRLGHAEEVKDFLEWYAPYQYPSGKVPCCVDSRGADPVPENDSHGELIYLAMEYYRHTGDRVVLEQMWPHVVKAVAYIDSLRLSRRTPVYETADSVAFRGLLPQSISHEGYSAKPMHSYWDDFFALKGLKDATEMARVLGKRPGAARIGRMRDEFASDVYASIGRAMTAHKIDYIPGSVELGDFDAPSTTIALAPAGEAARLPEPALRRTFERYWSDFAARRAGTKEWESYTPYELRTVGTALRLGWKDRAHALLDWFMSHHRPAGWNAWAEVVWRDPRAPKFIGDLPHTWVGSDFLRSVLDFFAYEREEDAALVVGDGIVEKWVSEAPGVTVRNLSTHYGPLSYAMIADGDRIRARIERGVRVPAGGIVVRSPRSRPVTAATVNGDTVVVRGKGDVVVRRLPAEIILSY